MTHSYIPSSACKNIPPLGNFFSSAKPCLAALLPRLQNRIALCRRTGSRYGSHDILFTSTDGGLWRRPPSVAKRNRLEGQYRSHDWCRLWLALCSPLPRVFAPRVRHEDFVFTHTRHPGLLFPASSYQPATSISGFSTAADTAFTQYRSPRPTHAGRLGKTGRVMCAVMQ
ncbi:hypothetical protein K431DRAFT_160243 [Polychaeton citri CBS 116435]|uniref:Uncharacterized protein n=1 Tax=Polychaeton citri CBS 116435 TaxID=1314669 RepID=A0A9P4PYI3_9PEZI|nr:hypothetical protein K431DRAFT_160243 [Polychaeton citri CBS 116435]